MSFRGTFLLSLILVTPPLLARDSFRPNLGPDLSTITVTCEEVRLLLRQASQWTPGRIDFRGSAMTTERSAYGTVFSFPGVGFIGTGHLENEPEVLKSLAFFLNERRVEQVPRELKGQTFRFERNSTIRGLHLENILELRNNQLHETATVRTEGSVPLKLVYHFMHAWAPSVSAFLAGSDDTPSAELAAPLSRDLETQRSFVINQRVDWVAVFDPESRQFAVSRLLQAPEQGEHISMIWNVPGTYQKYYLKCFQNATIPAGFAGTWKMVTGFGTGTPETWENAARQLAKDLKSS